MGYLNNNQHMLPESLYNKGETIYLTINSDVTLTCTIRGKYYDRWKYKCWMYYLNETGGSFKESQLNKQSPQWEQVKNNSCL